MIKGTFIDEISHDIPHQNWGRKEWEEDFIYMKKIGIELVILIRCGYKKWITYPSKVLKREVHAFPVSEDLVKLFLELSERYHMDFYFGLYDSGIHWTSNNAYKELEINRKVIDEVWKRYGHYRAFKGWYISQETNRKSDTIITLYKTLGRYCKTVSGGLKTLISPYIDGKKNISQYDNSVAREDGISITEHKKDWNDIFSQIKGAVDIVAFQDGHVHYDELVDFLKVNKELATTHGIECWTNTESFDRDMPIKFLPIKWDKLRLKLELAKKAGINKAITFEFSHFMSPQSAYIQAGHLYNRYKAYLNSKE
jgi:hypothetical protein